MKYLNGDMKKDVKNYRIESDSIIKTFSETEKREGATIFVKIVMRSNLQIVGSYIKNLVVVMGEINNAPSNP